MQQKHLHAPSELDECALPQVIQLITLIVGHRYDGQSSVPRDAASIHHQRTCIYPRYGDELIAFA